MGRPKKLVPGYHLHKRSGQAVAFVGRQTIYLGKHGSPESRRAYGELLSRLAAQPAAMQSQPTEPPAALSVAELVLAFVTKEMPRFSRSEKLCFQTALRLLVQLIAETPVAEFGPLKLRVLRDAMVSGDPHLKSESGEPAPRKPWSRRTVNRQVKRIRAVFRWDVSLELVHVTIVQSLETLRSLRIGETTAEEAAPRLAVSKSDIESVRAVLKPHHADVLNLLLLTGARPGEVLGLKVGDIERSGEIWRAELRHHKTACKGKARTLYFNPAAQTILLQHIGGKQLEDQVFRLRRDNFGAVIRRACRRAGVQAFVPHQLRHTVGTQVADELGTEAAQRLLGHAERSMTEHYSRAAERQAIEAAKTLGVS